MHVPDGWKRKEFSELAELRKTKINPKNSVANYLCVELEHIAQGTGKLLGTADTKDLASSKNVFHKGDVLFGKLRPYLKKYFYCNFDGVCSSEVWVLKAKSGCFNKYLYNVIQTHEFISTANVSSGSKMPRADWDYVAEYPVLIPPVSEQQKIAQILSTWDKAIEKLEALITAKQKRKKALMQKLLTRKKQFTGFDGKWEEVELGSLFKEVKEKVGRKNVTPHSITAGTGFVSHEEKWGKDISGSQYENYTLLKKHQFSYNKGNSKKYACGCMYLLKHVDEIAVPNVFISFERRNSNICNEFYEQYFMANYCSRELKRYITSGARSDGLLNLSKADFFSVRLPYPTIEEQQKIASVLSAADNEITAHQKQLNALKQQKKGLMHQLLTGKKRVKLDEPEQRVAMRA